MRRTVRLSHGGTANVLDTGSWRRRRSASGLDQLTVSDCLPDGCPDGGATAPGWGGVASSDAAAEADPASEDAGDAGSDADRSGALDSGCGTVYFQESFANDAQGWTLDPSWSIAPECASHQSGRRLRDERMERGRRDDLRRVVSLSVATGPTPTRRRIRYRMPCRCGAKDVILDGRCGSSARISVKPAGITVTSAGISGREAVFFIQPAVFFVQPAVIFGGASPTSVRDAVTFDDDAGMEEPASLPEIPSTRIEIIVDRLEVRPSMPDIRDAHPTVTARRTDDTAEGIEIPDARPSGEADGIDEPAEAMNEADDRLEIHDDGRNVVDAMTEDRDDRIDVIDATRDEPAGPTDQPARGGDVLDEGTDVTSRPARLFRAARTARPRRSR